MEGNAKIEAVGKEKIGIEDYKRVLREYPNLNDQTITNSVMIPITGYFENILITGEKSVDDWSYDWTDN